MEVISDFFFFFATLCGILVPQPRIKTKPPKVEAYTLCLFKIYFLIEGFIEFCCFLSNETCTLNHWTLREVLVILITIVLKSKEGENKNLF